MLILQFEPMPNLRYLLSVLCLLGSFHLCAQTPTAHFTYTMIPASGCPPVQVIFNAGTGSAYGSPTSFNWIGIPNAQTTNPSPSRTYLAAGTYTVTLVVSNASGQSQPVTKTITVHDTPTVAFTASPVTGCPPLNVTLNSAGTNLGAPGAGTYTWITTPGIGSGATTNIVFPTGTHDVTLQVTNSKGCMRSLKKNTYISVSPKPEVDFTASATQFCDAPTSNINFTSSIQQTTTGPYTYSWNLGQAPNQFQTTQNASKVYGPPKPASYPVTLVLTDANGCKDTMTKPAFVNILDVQASFTGPSTACIGTAVTFTSNNSPSSSVCDWFYGPGETPDLGVQPTAIHTFVTSGTKQVMMVAKYGPCNDTAYHNITINPQPTINFSYAPNPPCPPPTTLTFTATGATNYQWNFGTGTGIQATGNGVTHTYSTCGFYTPTLIAADANGCKDTLEKTEFVQVYCGEYKIKTAKEPEGCAPLTVNFSSVSSKWKYVPFYDISMPYVSPPVQYEWKFGVPSSPTLNSATPSYTYTAAGVYKATLKITTANGCIFYDTLEVRVGVPPDAKFTVDTVVCANADLKFFNQTTIPGFNGGVVEYEWIFGDDKGFTYVSNPTYKYDTAGVFCARLIAKYNGCPDTFIRCNIRVDSPVAKAQVVLNCANRLTVGFTNKSYGYTSHMWYFGDGPTSTSTQVHPTHVYPGYGTYNWMLVTFNSTSGCTDTAEGTLYLMKPSVVLSVSDSTICKNETARFNAVFINPSGTSGSYNWYQNNVLINKDSAVNYTHLFPNEGYHSIMVVMIDQMGCPDTAKKNNWMLVSKPAVNFTASPLLGCVPLTVTFTDNSLQVPAPAAPLLGAALSSRRWEFASPLLTPGITVPGAITSYTYQAAGAYDVKVVVTDASGCKDSMTRVGYINAHKPDANFTADDTAGCLNQTIAFTNNTGTAVSAKWYFGDGDTSLLMSPTHAYKTPGIYTVTMIATDAYGCKDTIIKANHIGITKPNAMFTVSPDSIAVCPPLIDTFDAGPSGSGLSYLWSFQGSSNQPTSAVTIEAFTNPGKFAVTLIVTDVAGCTDTAVTNVYILGYDGAFSYAPLTGCEPLDVNFTPSINNIPNIIWDFNDGNTTASGGGTVTHTYTTPGMYVPKIIMTDGSGCSSASLGKDTIKVDGAKADFYHSPACEGYKVTFTDTSTGYFKSITSRAWKFHTGQTGSAKTATHFYPAPGTYPVQIIVTNGNGCKDTLVRDIVVNGLPAISAGNDTVICLNDAAQLLGTGGVSYTWSPANSLSCSNCANPVASPTDTTIYMVIGTDANQCSDTDRVVVALKYKVDGTVGEGDEICLDETIMLTAGGGRTYQWTPADVLDDGTLANPTAKPKSNTKFMVIAKEGSCIPDTNYINIVVHPKPTIQATGDATIIAGKDAPLNASGELIKKFSWIPTSTLDCYDCPNPIAKPIRTTVYTATGTTEFGCQDSDKVTIIVLCDQSQLYIPNTFTPNGDGQNDVFYPRGEGFDKLRSFRVFNRWGEIVYERKGFALNEKVSGWDGTFRGRELPPDVFMYMIEADCDNGDVIQWKGDVTLIR